MEIAEVLQKIGYTNLRDFGTHYRTTPLYRASENSTSLSINKKSGEFYDFGAKTGGSLYRLVQLTLQLSTLDEAKEYAKNNSFPAYVPKAYRTEQHNELKEAPKFDKEMLKRLMIKHTYWINRNISEATLQIFNGGVALNGKLANRYVFPILTQKDELVGFAGRIIFDNAAAPKWKLIGTKTEWVYPLKYNQADIIAQKEVILVESIGDMLALWDCGIRNVLVTFGTELSIKIIQFLLKIDIQNIVIAFNNDADNNFIGNKAAVDASIELNKYFDPGQIKICLPSRNDFGEMSKEEIYLWKTNCLLRKD